MPTTGGPRRGPWSLSRAHSRHRPRAMISPSNDGSDAGRIAARGPPLRALTAELSYHPDKIGVAVSHALPRRRIGRPNLEPALRETHLGPAVRHSEAPLRTTPPLSGAAGGGGEGVRASSSARDRGLNG